MRIEPKINGLSSEEEVNAVSDVSTDEPGSFQSNVKQSALINVKNGQSVGTSSSSSDNSYQHSGAVKLPIKVTNITTSQQISDTLYQNSKSVSCNSHACLGSVMAQPLSTGNLRSREEILDQAAEFLEQYFIYMKKSDSSDLAQRLAEIATELERTGTYTLSREELHFGAKTAWRNASRCIGRIQWNKLELQDSRNVKNTSQMFDALCGHIRLATNGGNLRSFITVFPQRVPNREDFRVWNSQLISYAGYLQSDGSIIGDPGRMEFTKICQRLGWKGKNGRFDILPLVLSSPGEGVRFYDIPEDIILKVMITHPKYECFKNLNLEWYALPAVSEMQLDCGGLQFTGCPFNGWYMGTEVGARDFCDPQRYNLTENIAKVMELDISNPSTLWKDRALVEMNIAVLHSFQKAGVTIVDHHSASESFIKHMNTEYNQRGGCPADWVWIVPPISGSLTPVFHQEMINYSLRPSFEYQEKGWKTHKWINSSIKPQIRLISVSKAVIWTVRLLTKVLSKRIKATILFATETGKSEEFSLKLSKLMKISFNVRIVCMENYNFDDLYNESLVLVITSTFGNGEAPDNGKEFWKTLNKLNPNQTLIGLKYAVFALGSTQYPSFCAFGKNIDKCFKELGATPVLPIGLGDDLKGQELTFKSWGHDCYRSSCKSFDINIDNEEISMNDLEYSPFDKTKVRITEVFNETNGHHLQHELARLHRKKVISCKIITRVRLQPKDSERQTLLVRLSPSNTVAKNQFNYEPGDHLAIFPLNPKEIVNALIGHFIKNGYKDPDSNIQVQHLIDGKWGPDSRLPICSIREALTQYLDITTPPTQPFLNHLIDMANDNWDSFRLTKLSNDINDYEKWRSYNNPNLADLLNQFPSLHITPGFLLTQLSLLQPRYYSVSSSRKVTADELHLTIDLISYKIHGGVGPKRFGVCSSFIDRIPDTDIPCFLRSAPNFRLPEDNKLPIIMIGAGSGIAPFRGFWLQRQADLQNSQNCGKMFMFFGCRDTKANIYGPDLNALIKKGILHELFLAFSRQNGQKKRYIQDQVFKQRAILFWLITKESAHIYVCGHSLMANGVKKTFNRMFESEGKMNANEAQNLLTSLINEGRYHEDVFGIMH